jgi:hypothetical protein
MNYDKQILDIFTQVGEHGISVQVLTKHIYNLNVSFFFQPSQDDIYRYVQNYVRRHSGQKISLLERISYGNYRLNMNNNSDARQLILEFQEEQKSDTVDGVPEQPSVDLSLNLFD